MTHPLQMSHSIYRCNINIYERDWLSSEHPYQWIKMVKNGFDKEAQVILEAPHAAAEKKSFLIASRPSSLTTGGMIRS